MKIQKCVETYFDVETMTINEVFRFARYAVEDMEKRTAKTYTGRKDEEHNWLMDLRKYLRTPDNKAEKPILLVHEGSMPVWHIVVKSGVVHLYSRDSRLEISFTNRIGDVAFVEYSSDFVIQQLELHEGEWSNTPEIEVIDY